MSSESQPNNSESSPPVKPRKSEQIPATDDIVEVAPGILRTQLPIDFTGLGHVNMYVLEDERGVAVVDPGLPTRESWNAIRKRLKDIGVPMKRVHSIIVTHSHPDHYGGAARLRAHSGAELVGHKMFRTWWDPKEPPDVDVEDMPRRFHHPFRSPPWGGPVLDFSITYKLRYVVKSKLPVLFRIPRPTIRLGENDRIRFARREWLAIHTPGHTEDHLCLFDPEEGTLITGDHILPSITPHISGLTGHGDPLSLFFESLDKVDALAPQVKISLPAHGTPFTNLHERVEHIKVHHDERLQKLRNTSEELGRPASVMEFSQHLFSPRVQGPMAHSETFAHLEHLRISGDFERRDNNGVLEYVIQ